MSSIAIMAVHGHSVVLERVGAPDATGKKSVHEIFAGNAGDIIDLRTGHASAACLRIGRAARFVVFDNGTKNQPKSGAFWCHLAVPTPSQVAYVSNEEGVFATGFKPVNITGDWESNNPLTLFIDAVHVWHGGLRRVHRDDSVPRGNGTATRYFKPFVNAPLVTQGLGASFRVRAVNARDNWLELRSVAIAFEGPELGASLAPGQQAAELLMSEGPAGRVD
jgi:hypothetical protein